MALNLLYADRNGTLLEHPRWRAAGWDGARVRPLEEGEVTPLPPGSDLVFLPGRRALAWDGRPVEMDGYLAVAAVLPPGFTRLLLPAWRTEEKAPVLPLRAYTAVGMARGRVYAAAWRIPGRHRAWSPLSYRPEEVRAAVARRRRAFPGNRLVEHLARCALEYRCLTAINLMLGRGEAGLPVSPACNAACVGCISWQPAGGVAAQERLGFVPTVGEIVPLMLHHLQNVRRAIVSFGQGCEGEPLLQARLLVEAIGAARARAAGGTININTNGSRPEVVPDLAAAGLDSVRVSLLSARPETYAAYHRPAGFNLGDVVRFLEASRRHGLFTSLNLLVMPGLSDRPEEMEALLALIRETGVRMVQLRNLNLDPEVFFDAVGRAGGPPQGIRNLIGRLQRVPGLELAAYSRPVR